MTHCPAALLPGLSVAVPAPALKIIPCLSRVPFGALSAIWPLSKAIAFDGWHLGALVPVIVTARTVQGMARVRSGQAPAWPSVSDRSVRRGSGVKRDVAYVHLALFTCARRPAVTVTLEAGGADTDTQRAIPGSEPSQGSCTFGVSPCRSTSLGDQCPRAAGLSPGVW